MFLIILNALIIIDKYKTVELVTLNLPSLKVAETFDLSTFGPTFEGG
jgi:hypothetical protein